MYRSKMNIPAQLKIFYTASFYGKSKYQTAYDLVLKKIEENPGVNIFGTEKGNYLELLDKSKSNKISDKNLMHYEAVRKGILWADAVIMETSNEDFQLGYEAGMAVQLQKPILCLSLIEERSLKIRSPYFQGHKYNKYNLGLIIRDFILYLKKEKLSERFNCFLSKEQINYLEVMAQKEGANKSEYLRKLIDNDKELNKLVQN